jgi:hypothetical protein
MNWNLIVRLSFFGFLMGGLSVSFLPQPVEFIGWLVISVFCAYTIAKRCDRRYFLNGFMLNMLNTGWVTGFHVIFYKAYLSEHPSLDLMYSFLPFSDFPQLGMLAMAPVFGVFFGLLLGLFSFMASKFVKPEFKGSN